MLNSKCLPNHSPSSVVDEILTAQGFDKIIIEEQQYYQTKFKDTVTQIKYGFYIPLKTRHQAKETIGFGRAYFEQSKEVPLAIQEAAQGKLLEIADYLNHVRPPLLKRKKKGYMVRNFKELQKLGKEMSSLKTNAEVYESGQVPDPIQ